MYEPVEPGRMYKDGVSTHYNQIYSCWSDCVCHPSNLETYIRVSPMGSRLATPLAGNVTGSNDRELSDRMQTDQRQAFGECRSVGSETVP